MNDKSKELFDLSICLIVFAAFDIVDFLLGIFSMNFDEMKAKAIIDNPDMSADLIITVAITSIAVVSATMALLQVITAIKGISESKKPTKAKFHIIIATVLTVLCVIGGIGAISSLIAKDATVLSNIVSLITSALDAVILILFVKSAKAVQVA